jgi:hypothetical protein
MVQLAKLYGDGKDVSCHKFATQSYQLDNTRMRSLKWGAGDDDARRLVNRGTLLWRVEKSKLLQ